jgi:hypothetical protein
MSVEGRTDMRSAAIIVGVPLLLAWLTHIVVCIQQSKFFLLVIGVWMPFVGIIHGLGLWLGIFSYPTRAA